MAISSFFALFDDIALLLDDVAVMSKVAMKKTAGVLGDDLALNAQQVVGVRTDRELPVVWAVAKGSFVNKLILVPLALLISAVLPQAITPLLMLGGLFLCFEGVEKLFHRFIHSPQEDDARADALREALDNPAVDPVQFEKDKIKGAVRTDFILSAEIIVITLGTMASASFSQRVAVLSVVAIIMTVAVYGLVAGIIRLDDWGQKLLAIGGSLQKALGQFLLALSPKLMRFLSFVGTLAMFLVGGAILVHGLAPVHHAVQAVVQNLAGAVATMPWLVKVVETMVPLVGDLVVGVLSGAAALAVWLLVQKVFKLGK